MPPIAVKPIPLLGELAQLKRSAATAQSLLVLQPGCLELTWKQPLQSKQVLLATTATQSSLYSWELLSEEASSVMEYLVWECKNT